MGAGHRYCFMCSRRIHAYETGYRVAKVGPSDYSSGYLMFWLCEKDYAKTAKAIEKVTA